MSSREIEQIVETVEAVKQRDSEQLRPKTKVNHMNTATTQQTMKIAAQAESDLTEITREIGEFFENNPESSVDEIKPKYKVEVGSIIASAVRASFFLGIGFTESFAEQTVKLTQDHLNALNEQIDSEIESFWSRIGDIRDKQLDAKAKEETQVVGAAFGFDIMGAMAAMTGNLSTSMAFLALGESTILSNQIAYEQSISVGGLNVTARAGLKIPQMLWVSERDNRVCFPTRTMIYTNHGQREIQKIKIGDLVLTHKGRYRKVLLTNKRKYNGDFVTLRFGIYNTKKSGSELKLTATGNHPILANDRWTEFRNVKQGDIVKILASRCPICDKKIPFIHQFCSNRCVGIHANKIIWSDPKQHERVTRQSTERMKNPKLLKRFRDASRKAILENHDSWRHKQSKKMKAWHRRHPDWKPKYGFQIPEHYQRCAKIIGSNMISYPEKQVGKWLDEIGVEYQTQHPVKNGKSYNNRQYYYYLDYAIPEIKLSIEVDGNRYHQNRRHEDRKRDLENMGWRIIHINARDVKINPEHTKQKLGYELCNYFILANHEQRYEFIEITVKNTLSRQTQNQTVYNLKVEEDETFLAKGVVVHNCPICLNLDGRTWPVTDRSMPRPVRDSHPGCRCRLLPMRGGRAFNA